MSGYDDFASFVLSDTLPLSSSSPVYELLLESSPDNVYKAVEYEIDDKFISEVEESLEQQQPKKAKRASPRSKEEMVVVRQQQAKAREQKPQRAAPRTKEQMAVVREQQARAREEKLQRAPRRTKEEMAVAKELQAIYDSPEETRKRALVRQHAAMNAAFAVAPSKKPKIVVID